jgi:hypothetical protein
MLKIYLDNDVSSAITRRDLEKAELDALDLLIDCKRHKRIILDTSRQSPREMERAPEISRESKEGPCRTWASRKGSQIPRLLHPK